MTHSHLIYKQSPNENEVKYICYSNRVFRVLKSSGHQISNLKYSSIYVPKLTTEDQNDTSSSLPMHSIQQPKIYLGK